MTAGLTIVHIEDEFREYLDLVTFVKTSVEDHFEEKDNVFVVVTNKIVGRCPNTPMNWVAYELSCEHSPNLRICYLFVRDRVLPDEAKTFIYDQRAFILDVLRPADNGQLVISVDESIGSIAEFAVEVPYETVVLFSAHQGTGLEKLGKNAPRKISKESESELEEFIMSHVNRHLSDG